jgi:hypothetical protein
MKTAIVKWAKQCLPWVNTHSTIESIDETTNLLDTGSCSQVFAAAPY